MLHAHLILKPAPQPLADDERAIIDRRVRELGPL
jgi:hypothetical protein